MRRHKIRALGARASIDFPVDSAFEDTKKLKIKDKPCCCQNFKEFSANTSLHGIKFIGESERSTFERIWWSLILILSFFCCTFLITKVWIKWNTSPVIVSLEENTTPVWDIPFPAVTICPNPKSDTNEFNFSRACDPFNGLTKKETTIYKVNSIFCSDECVREKSNFIPHRDFLAYKKVTLKKEKILMFCMGLGSRKDVCDNKITETLTEDGMCFTVNLLSAAEIFTEQASANIEIMRGNNTSNGWNIDKGYPSDAPFYTYPYRAKANGMVNSFGIKLLHYKNNTDLMCNPADSGFKVILNAPHIIPNTLREFFWVQIGTDMSVSLTPNMMITSPELRSYSPNVRQCYFADERKLRYFKEYSRNHCELECLTNLTLEVCDCVTPMMPRNTFTMVCGYGEKNCVDSVKDEFVKIGIYTDSKEFDEKERIAYEKATKCDCLPSCTSIVYETSISQAEFDWEVYQKAKNLSGSFTGTSMSTLSIYFKESYFIKSKRSELYGLVDFLANCGGLLGVFLGFSILSLVEIFYFFFLRLLIRKKT